MVLLYEMGTLCSTHHLSYSRQRGGSATIVLPGVCDKIRYCIRNEKEHSERGVLPEASTCLRYHGYFGWVKYAGNIIIELTSKKAGRKIPQSTYKVS